MIEIRTDLHRDFESLCLVASVVTVGRMIVDCHHLLPGHAIVARSGLRIVDVRGVQVGKVTTEVKAAAYHRVDGSGVCHRSGGGRSPLQRARREGSKEVKGAKTDSNVTPSASKRQKRARSTSRGDVDEVEGKLEESNEGGRFNNAAGHHNGNVKGTDPNGDLTRTSRKKGHERGGGEIEWMNVGK